jgi:hypothetical protein
LRLAAVFITVLLCSAGVPARAHDQEKTMTKNAFQKVPVPTQYVMKVYRFLSDLERGVSPVEAEPAENVDEDIWTDEMLRRLAGSDKKAVIILCKVLDVLSAAPHAGEWFSLAELEEGTGETQHQLRYIWSSLTRHFDSAYDTRTWPVQAQWGTSFSPAKEPVMFYSVTVERAEQWKRVTGK